MFTCFACLGANTKILSNGKLTTGNGDKNPMKRRRVIAVFPMVFLVMTMIIVINFR